MIYRMLVIILCFTSLLAGTGLAEDRDISARDLKGVPKSHRYLWAMVGGAGVGAGIGIIAPGGTKSAIKGALLGGSLTSAIYLAKKPRAADGWRDWAHVGTNAALGTGILWTLCNCHEGAWAGGLIGGGGTAVYQALGSHDHRIATLTGSNPQSGTGSQVGSSGSTQPVASAQLPDPNNPNSRSKKAATKPSQPAPKKPQQELQ